MTSRTRKVKETSKLSKARLNKRKSKRDLEIIENECYEHGIQQQTSADIPKTEPSNLPLSLFPITRSQTAYFRLQPDKRENDVPIKSLVGKYGDIPRTIITRSTLRKLRENSYSPCASDLSSRNSESGSSSHSKDLLQLASPPSSKTFPKPAIKTNFNRPLEEPKWNVEVTSRRRFKRNRTKSSRREHAKLHWNYRIPVTRRLPAPSLSYKDTKPDNLQPEQLSNGFSRIMLREVTAFKRPSVSCFPIDNNMYPSLNSSPGINCCQISSSYNQDGYSQSSSSDSMDRCSHTTFSDFQVQYLPKETVLPYDQYKQDKEASFMTEDPEGFSENPVQQSKLNSAAETSKTPPPKRTPKIVSKQSRRFDFLLQLSKAPKPKKVQSWRPRKTTQLPMNCSSTRRQKQARTARAILKKAKDNNRTSPRHESTIRAIIMKYKTNTDSPTLHRKPRQVTPRTSKFIAFLLSPWMLLEKFLDS